MKAVRLPLVCYADSVSCIATTDEHLVTRVALCTDERIISGSARDFVLPGPRICGSGTTEGTRGHWRALLYIPLSTDGNRIMSGSEDWTATMWPLRYSAKKSAQFFSDYKKGPEQWNHFKSSYPRWFRGKALG